MKFILMFVAAVCIIVILLYVVAIVLGAITAIFELMSPAKPKPEPELNGLQKFSAKCHKNAADNWLKKNPAVEPQRLKTFDEESK